ncbi:MAG: hypothetical protein A2511_13375 [Deltaproteobacteria bacterium RIFOXYD12_FULL_50_9]|nr:MAG: hypothetical protein A2511_13375 [Deltaproteobacteria bacterium RIFOXYD12_FULL_50_9]
MNNKISASGLAIWVVFLCQLFSPLPSFVSAATTMDDYTAYPPFLASVSPPLVMLVMGKDHKLYYEAYNDASDLNGDGKLDVGYKPATIDYYGYFDSNKCYTYDNTSTPIRFRPSVATGANKTCAGATEWSGDFLNYLTMTRMDALRKVLYGGYRKVDTAAETVLERAFVPQDAHSWGKEYLSVAYGGYDIRDYTPLDLPAAGKRHLFASTTLSNAGAPVLRVLPDSGYRIWDWVSKERPVADNSLISASNAVSPNNHLEYNALVAEFATPAATSSYRMGSQNVTTINGSGNPFRTGAADDDNYMTIFSGVIAITTNGNKGNYEFAVDGDDAVEVIVDGTVVAGWYGGHGKCTCTDHKGTIYLGKSNHTVEFRHHEMTGDDNYYLRWKGPMSGNNWEIIRAAAFTSLTQTVYKTVRGTGGITDYEVRVQACEAGKLESNCQQYPSLNSKPIGLLQRHGEPGSMMFGLLTGSYTKNMSGGVLRKNIGPITDEINVATNGTFTATNGIIRTIDKLRVNDFDYGSYSYSGGWLTTSAMSEGTFPMWGNPVGEMMYETLRYFGGAASQSADFWSATMAKDDALGLPNVAWVDPYRAVGGYATCQKPFLLVLSDIYPSFDSDKVPGSADSTFGGMDEAIVGQSTTKMNVKTLADTISNDEGIGDGKEYFLGQVGGTSDNTCQPKGVTDGLGNVRGLCPEEPTKQGSYSSAAVAYYGRTATPSKGGNVLTYSVGLASPLPRIEIPIGTGSIALLPFAKSVGGAGIVNINDAGTFLPTNTIVDFYVDTLDVDNPTYGKFRINYEDVEQGADHDMDAIAEYEYQVYKADGVTPATTPAEGATVNITVTSTYAAGSIMQHLGYIISGSTANGTYLVVRDKDTAAASDPNYRFDYPGGKDNLDPLPLTSTLTFTPGATAAATQLENPLYYAAKWGGFEDTNDSNTPDKTDEWDKDHDGVPDTYFYVVNPLKLEEQLNKSFASILMRTASGTAASIISNSRSGEGAIYQAVFFPSQIDGNNRKISWAGDLHSLWLDDFGNMREDTDHNQVLDSKEDRIVEFYVDTAEKATKVKRFKDDDGDGRYISGVCSVSPTLYTQMDQCTSHGGSWNPSTDQVANNINLRDMDYLWSAGEWLASTELLASTQRDYAVAEKKRYIFTSFDGVTEVAFTPEITTLKADPAKYKAYLNTATETEADDIVNFVRGTDINGYRSRQINWDNAGAVETYRLGDIVHSTPTVIAAPIKSYDTIYGDESYRQFRKKYLKRRSMIYAGGNDGGLHAFNGGFYDKVQNKFLNGPPSAIQYDLGSEMWMYIPKNLLPHLKWLTSIAYTHVYYVDLKPEIFDAKIFTPDAVHPNGWGTILVGGMRLGGGDLTLASGETTRSAYFILDITNPEQPPDLLAEFTDPNLGFTIGQPKVFPMLRCDLSTTGSCTTNSTAWPMDWYLAFGSGPFGPSTSAGIRNTLKGTSTQEARLYVLKLGSTDAPVTTTPPALVADYPRIIPAASFPKSFFSDLLSADFDLDFRTDVLYFGSIANTDKALIPKNFWGGMHRLVINDDLTPATWSLNTFYNAGQPVSAAPSASYDGTRFWVYFGTGRFFDPVGDKSDTTQQSFYGLKESYDANGHLDLTSANGGNLVNVSNVWVENINGNLWENETTPVEANLSTGVDTLSAKTFREYNYEISAAKYHGWKINFSVAGERNLGQPAILGEIVTFTTYVPSTEICSSEGESFLWALYYRTGTSYFHSVIGLQYLSAVDKEKTQRKKSLGSGMATTPNIHVGAETGSKAFVQTSTGAIIGIQETNPGATKSGMTSWRDISADE